jgi:alpha-D-ribose 1-methylphosphonate 5-triphosphate diphosphatase
MPTTSFTDAKIVTPNAVVEGSLLIADGRIEAVTAEWDPFGRELDGDYLLPGLIEVHTDNMERHFVPRPGVRWPGRSAITAHDGQMAAAGITTVLDAVSLGSIVDSDTRLLALQDMLDSVRQADEADMLRVEHLLHLRCEVSYPNMPELLANTIDDARVRLVSVMDHTPGQRQFVNVDKYRQYYKGKLGYMEIDFDDYIRQACERGERYSVPNRRAVVDICRAHGITMASHDDATPEHVDAAIADGMVVAEFPTTVDAAQRSRAGGMKVVMGGPNLIRGGSHSGNVSALMLAEAGLLDIVSSDYVPASLLESAFALPERVPAITLPQAVATVSVTPAEAVGLDDRGALVAGRRADFLRVRVVDGHPVVREVWRGGQRVA